MVAVPLRAGLGNAIEGALNNGRLPQDQEMARAFIREMKASVTNQSFQALVIDLLAKGNPELAKDPGALQEESSRLVARIRTVVLTIATALAFRVGFSGLTEVDIRDLINHKDIDGAKDVPDDIKDLVKLIHGQKVFFEQEQWDSLINSLVDWLKPDPETGQSPDIETLIESGRAVTRNLSEYPIDQSTEQPA